MRLEFSLSEKNHSLGNHFIVGLSGTVLSDLDKRILGTLRPAGVLLLKRNFNHGVAYPAWLGELRRLLDDVRAYAEREEIIVSIDHEGGAVMRTPPPLTRFPEPMAYARKAGEVGAAMALELRSIGVNVSWAPLADIHSNPLNPVIGRRALGTTSDEVAQRSLLFARALEANGVLGCAKHFPGHGDTDTDSHRELPRLELTEAELRDRELRPFRALIESGIPFVMTGHILFPKIDPLWPATLSPRILAMLRNELGFGNIIISDDIGMGAVADSFATAETLGHAFSAGCDMFIVARAPDTRSERPLALARDLFACLRRHTVTEAGLHAAYERIRGVCADRISPSTTTPLDAATLQRHEELRLDVL